MSNTIIEGFKEKIDPKKLLSRVHASHNMIEPRTVELIYTDGTSDQIIPNLPLEEFRQHWKEFTIWRGRIGKARLGELYESQNTGREKKQKRTEKS